MEVLGYRQNQRPAGHPAGRRRPVSL